MLQVHCHLNLLIKEGKLEKKEESFLFTHHIISDKLVFT